MRATRLLERGWNALGAPLVLACYFAGAVPTPQPGSFWDAEPRVVRPAIGAGVVVGVHAAWWALWRHVDAAPGVLAGAWKAWHAASSCTVGVGYALVLCRPLRGPDSAPGIPLEHCYTPVLLAACLIAPRLCGGCGGGKAGGGRGEGWAWRHWAWLAALALNFACFVVVAEVGVARAGVPPRALEPWWCFGVYVALCAIYAVPLPTVGPGRDARRIDGSEIFALACAKAAAVAVGVVWFYESSGHARAAPGRGRGGGGPHDFYPLRLAASGLAAGTALRLAAVLSLLLLYAQWYTHLAPPGGRGSLDVHELRVAAAALAVVLGAFSVDPHHDYRSAWLAHGVGAAQAHSAGFVHSQAVTWAGVAAVALLAWIRSA